MIADASKFLRALIFHDKLLNIDALI